MARRASEEGIALIKRFEGLRLSAYADLAGVWTIGYGHTGAAAAPGARVTEDEAEALLRSDLRRFESAVSGALRREATQPQFDALVSLAFNIGAAAFSRSSVLRRLNAGDVPGAAEAIGWWNKARVDGRLRTVPGLVRRRAAETALFLEEVADDDDASGLVLCGLGARSGLLPFFRTWSPPSPDRPAPRARR